MVRLDKEFSHALLQYIECMLNYKSAIPKAFIEQPISIGIVNNRSYLMGSDHLRKWGYPLLAMRYEMNPC